MNAQMPDTSMSRSSRTRRVVKGKGIMASEKSWRGVAVATVGFAAILSVLVVASYIEMPTAGSKESTTNNHPFLYHRVNDIPGTVIRALDAVLIVGGGVPSSLDKPPRYVQRRCDDGAAVVRRHDNITAADSGRLRQPLPILCLSAGTKHLPQLLSADGLPIFESTSCAAYLEETFDLTKYVYVETTSFDTIGNAFFARTTHTDINGWRHLLIVTNKVRVSSSNSIPGMFNQQNLTHFLFSSFICSEQKLYLNGSLIWTTTMLVINSTFCSLRTRD